MEEFGEGGLQKGKQPGECGRLLSISTLQAHSCPGVAVLGNISKAVLIGSLAWFMLP